MTASVRLSARQPAPATRYDTCKGCFSTYAPGDLVVATDDPGVLPQRHYPGCLPAGECETCRRPILRRDWDDRHSDPETGDDFHAWCCPTCEETS